MSFFKSHRFPIAVAAKEKGLDIVIGYGETGGINLKIFENEGFNIKHIPMYRGSINPIKKYKKLFFLSGNF